MDRYLYKCLVHEPDSDRPFYQAYWAYAHRLGVALDAIRDAAKSNGLNHAILCEADPIEMNTISVEVFPSTNDDVFWAVGRYFYPADPDAPRFELPTGVIACDSNYQDGDDPDPFDIKPAYTTWERDGTYFIDVVTGNDSVIDHFSRLLTFFEPFRVFMYRIHGHWEGDEHPDEFLVNESLNSADDIVAHLSGNLPDSIQNGFVSLTAYAQDADLTVGFSEHKILEVQTRSSSLMDDAIRFFESLGYESTTPFVAIDRRIHHWHYQPSNGREKAACITNLKALGFTSWTPGD